MSEKRRLLEVCHSLIVLYETVQSRMVQFRGEASKRKDSSLMYEWRLISPSHHKSHCRNPGFQLLSLEQRNHAIKCLGQRSWGDYSELQPGKAKDEMLGHSRLREKVQFHHLITQHVCDFQVPIFCCHGQLQVTNSFQSGLPREAVVQIHLPQSSHTLVALNMQDLSEGRRTPARAWREKWKKKSAVRTSGFHPSFATCLLLNFSPITWHPFPERDD